jgi:hypothetical protein
MRGPPHQFGKAIPGPKFQSTQAPSNGLQVAQRITSECIDVNLKRELLPAQCWRHRLCLESVELTVST